MSMYMMYHFDPPNQETFSIAFYQYMQNTSDILERLEAFTTPRQKWGTAMDDKSSQSCKDMLNQ